MFCKYCGKQVKDGARFCGECGKELDVPTKVIEKNQNHINSEPVESARQSSTPAKSRTNWTRWAGIISAVVITATGTSFLNDDGDKKTPSQKPSSTVTTPNVHNIKPAPKTSQNVAPKSYDAKVRPRIEEFEWTKNVMKNGIWPEAQKITAFKDISGTWKCMNTYDPARKMNNYCRDISNVTISGAEGKVTVLYDWYQIYYEGEPPHDMTKGPKTTLTGSYKKSNSGTWELSATSKGTRIIIDNFYLYKGKQYALGSIVVADGTVGDVTMVRP